MQLSFFVLIFFFFHSFLFCCFIYKTNETRCSVFGRALVFVVIPNPILSGLRIFVAALWRQVEETVGGIYEVNPARVGGVGVVNVAVLVTVKRADALKLVNVHV